MPLLDQLSAFDDDGYSEKAPGRCRQGSHDRGDCLVTTALGICCGLGAWVVVAVGTISAIIVLVALKQLFGWWRIDLD